ncbi:MAG: DUF2325 domain-containing protein [Cyanobacteria bacterium P01_D01_bin.73]
MFELTDIDELENSVKTLIKSTNEEVEARRLEKQRDKYYQEALGEIKSRLEGLLKSVNEALEQLPEEEFSDSTNRQQLLEKKVAIEEQIQATPAMAAEIADRQLILQEERLLEEKQHEQDRVWRQQLKQDLLDMIHEQTDFFSATDAAIAVRGYIHDLRAIGGLEEVVNTLIAQINDYSEEGAVARVRGSFEQTLAFIYDKAMQNRSRVDRGPELQPRTRHRSSERRPKLYTQLAGKVVIFGGHDRLQTAVKNRLRDSQVELVWYSTQSGVNLAQQGESQISSADLVIIVTGYASHSLTEGAMQTAKKLGVTPEMVNTTGMTKLLETIEVGLKTRQFADRVNTA